MSQDRPSRRLQNLLDNESISVQRQIIRETLVPLLDRVQKSEAEAILLSARRCTSRYNSLPKIDLASKKVEVNNLLDDLTRLAKAGAHTTHEHFESIMFEAIESISSWLNDVWTTAFEFGMDFVKMHSCLVFSIGVVEHIRSLRGSCQCIFESIDIPVNIKDRLGQVLKTFDEAGVKNVIEAIFWVWREVLLSLLASKDATCISLMPDLLVDIDDLAGWDGLERLLCGGKTFEEHVKDRTSKLRKGEIDDLESDFDEFDDYLHADHWGYKLSRRAPKLRRLVFDRLLSIFRVSPSTKLFDSLLSMSPDDKSLQDLDETLASIATVSGMSLATALEVYANEGKTDEIEELLNSHYYLLGPQDLQAAEKAVKVLMHNPRHQDSVLEFMRRELMDTIHSIHHALKPLFSGMDTPSRREDLTRIVRMRRGSPNRQEEIERWVESVVTPGPNNPMAFAAMMMGFTLPGLHPPDETEELFDMTLHDEDLVELREQLCPDLKKRLRSWVGIAEGMREGHVMLNQIYNELLEILPCMQAEDLVEEMIGRIVDRPSKHHICEALEYASKFVASQKRYARRQARKVVSSRMHSPISSEQEPDHFFDVLGDVD